MGWSGSYLGRRLSIHGSRSALSIISYTMLVPEHVPRLLIATSVSATLAAFMLPFAEHYRRRGWVVDAAHGGEQNELVDAAFDQVHRLPWTRKPWEPANLLGTPPLLRKLVRANDYDIVHLHDPVAAFVGRYSLRRLRAAGRPRVVYTAHGFHFYKGAPRANALVFGALEWTASRWTDRLIVINREDEAAAKRFPVPGSVVRYFPGIGVDLDKYSADRASAQDVASFRDSLGLRPGQPLVAMVAEFNPGKRHLDAVDALAEADRPELHLALAGEGPMLPQVRARVHELGLDDRVHFLGFRRDVPVILKSSIGLLLPSEREGLPRCIMEAASMEIPVLSTRIRGVIELVSPGTGELTAVGDVHAMAAVLRAWVDDPASAKQMGRAGRLAMRKFDLKHVLQLHDDLYAELLAEPASS